MLIEMNVLMCFGVIWISAPRLPGRPGVAKLFHVAPDSVHGSVTWYRVSASPGSLMKSTRLALTIVELAGICPSPGPNNRGNLTRVLHTSPATSQVPSTFSVRSLPKFVSGAPLEMYVSSVSLKSPPSPRWKVERTRSPIVRGTVTVLERLAFVAPTTRLKVPRGEVALVLTRRLDAKIGEPLAGESVHTVAEGQPDTLSATGSGEAPRTFTFAPVASFRGISNDVGSAETEKPDASRIAASGW